MAEFIAGLDGHRTKGSTVAPQLVVSGLMSVTNTGARRRDDRQHHCQSLDQVGLNLGHAILGHRRRDPTATALLRFNSEGVREQAPKAFALPRRASFDQDGWAERTI